MASRDASSNASSVRLNEFTSLDELALLSGPGFARNGRPPLRTLSSLDGVGVVRQSRVGLLRLPRLRLLRRLAKRFRLACTSLLHRPTDRSDPVATPSLDPPAGAGQDSDALPLSSVLLLDGQEQLGDLPDHLKYDPVRHARADLPAYSYITEEVWRCIGEQAAGFYFPEGDGADDIVQFYVSVLMVTDEVKCILPPSLERDHSINTMRKLARDMLNDPFLRHMGYFF